MAILAALPIACAAPAAAQEAESSQPTAEEMIQAAREAYRPPGVWRPCPEAAPGEIVVCARQEDQRLTSPTEDAIAAGQAVDDGLPRAPDVFGIPEGGVTVAKGCFIPPCPPPMPPIIDLLALPEPLTPEEAAGVFRAEDLPSPGGASPAAAP